VRGQLGSDEVQLLPKAFGGDYADIRGGQPH
jgi:hypothetical protein